VNTHPGASPQGEDLNCEKLQKCGNA